MAQSRPNHIDPGAWAVLGHVHKCLKQISLCCSFSNCNLMFPFNPLCWAHAIIRPHWTGLFPVVPHICARLTPSTETEVSLRALDSLLTLQSINQSIQSEASTAISHREARPCVFSFWMELKDTSYLSQSSQREKKKSCVCVCVKK